MTLRLSYFACALCGPTLLAVVLGAQQPATPPAGLGVPAGQGAPVVPDGQPKPGQPGFGRPPRGPQGPTNLKVLPANTDLHAVMHQYTADLGVGCEFCHAPADPVTHVADRASDANPTKEVARYMIQMTSDLNAKYLPLIKDRHDTNPVTCGTCHRGQKHPAVFAAPSQPAGSVPAGPPPVAVPAH